MSTNAESAALRVRRIRFARRGVIVVLILTGYQLTGHQAWAQPPPAIQSPQTQQATDAEQTEQAPQTKQMAQTTPALQTLHRRRKMILRR